jgi:hypothetical protein
VFGKKEKKQQQQVDVLKGYKFSPNYLLFVTVKGIKRKEDCLNVVLLCLIQFIGCKRMPIITAYWVQEETFRVFHEKVSVHPESVS